MTPISNIYLDSLVVDLMEVCLVIVDIVQVEIVYMPGN